MAGHRPFSTLRDRMKPERRARIKAEADSILAEMALAELRQGQNVTQEELSRLLDADQGNISKLERRTDMFISTLRRYIEALGGRLEIIAHFPDRDVSITQFQDDAA